MIIYGISDLVEFYKLYRKHNTNASYTHQNTAITIQGSITIPIWFPLPVSLRCSLSWHWVSPVARKEYTGWSQLKPTALFKFFWGDGCSFLMFCVGLRRIHLPHVSLANSERYTLLMNSWRNIYITIWSTQLFIAVYLKHRSPFSLIF